MNNIEANRQIVQQGLDARAAERRDAILESQARKLRLIINANHTAKTTHRSPERPQEATNVTEEERVADLARRTERRAQMAHEAKECTAWYRLLFQIFAPLLAAAFVSAIANTVEMTILMSTFGAVYIILIVVNLIKELLTTPGSLTRATKSV